MTQGMTENMTQDLFCYDLLRARKKRSAHTLRKANYLARDMENTLLKRAASALEQPQGALKKVLIIGCPGDIIRQQLAPFNPDTFDPLTDDHFSDQKLPFDSAHYDLIIESLTFHWLNKPLHYLSEIHRVLKPGGLYLSAFLGGTTLTELRQVLLQTDIDLYEGAFARVSPMIKPEAATRLLQTAGFKDPIVDHDEIGVNYPGLKSLIKDLRLMGESNALKEQRSPKISKAYFNVAQANYASHSKDFTATFDFVFMTGWRSL